MKKGFIVYILLLVVIGFFLYAFNLKNVLFWDDEDWIINNPAVHSLTAFNLKFIFSHDTLAGIGLRSNYYRPFLFLTFLFNYLVGGIKPLGYHLVSNLIHIANGILIFGILYSLFKRKLLAFLASLMFLIHPLQTEAVTYISGRGDPLSVFFMLLALWLFATCTTSQVVQVRLAMSYRYGLSLILFILAILSRETAFLFPVYLMIFLMSFVYREKFWLSFKKSFIKTVPFFAVSLIYGILRLTVLNFKNTLNFFDKPNVYTEHLYYRLLTFGHALAVYFKLIFFPTGLRMERDISVNTSLFQWPVWPAAILLLVILYAVIKDFNRTRLWFFSWGIFFTALLPTSGIFPINALIYEHWLYFSLFGFFTLAAFYLDKLFNLFGNKRFTKILLIVFLAVYFGFLAKQTTARNIIWGQFDKFYENILEYEPDNVRALTNLANIYADRKELEKAEKLLWRATEVNDVQPQPYYNLGNILQTKGDTAGAIELYKKSLEVDKNFPYAYQNLAGIYAKQGRLPEALDSLQKLSSITPFNPEVWYNLALAERAAGNKKEALGYARKAKELLPAGNPKSEELLNELMQTLK